MSLDVLQGEAADGYEHEVHLQQQIYGALWNAVTAMERWSSAVHKWQSKVTGEMNDWLQTNASLLRARGGLADYEPITAPHHTSLTTTDAADSMSGTVLPGAAAHSGSGSMPPGIKASAALSPVTPPGELTIMAPQDIKWPELRSKWAAHSPAASRTSMDRGGASRTSMERGGASWVDRDDVQTPSGVSLRHLGSKDFNSFGPSSPAIGSRPGMAAGAGLAAHSINNSSARRSPLDMSFHNDRSSTGGFGMATGDNRGQHWRHAFDMSGGDRRRSVTGGQGGGSMLRRVGSSSSLPDLIIEAASDDEGDTGSQQIELPGTPGRSSVPQQGPPLVPRVPRSLLLMNPKPSSTADDEEGHLEY